jgi:hypothetical protein
MYQTEMFTYALGLRLGGRSKSTAPMVTDEDLLELEKDLVPVKYEEIKYQTETILRDTTPPPTNSQVQAKQADDDKEKARRMMGHMGPDDDTLREVKKRSRSRTESVDSSTSQTSRSSSRSKKKPNTQPTTNFKTPLPKPTQSSRPQTPIQPVASTYNYFNLPSNTNSMHWMNSPTTHQPKKLGQGGGSPSITPRPLSSPIDLTTGGIVITAFNSPSPYRGSGDAFVQPSSHWIGKQNVTVPIITPKTQYNHTPVPMNIVTPPSSPRTIGGGAFHAPQSFFPPGGNNLSQLVEIPRPRVDKAFIFRCAVEATAYSQNSPLPSISTHLWAQADQGSDLNLIAAAAVPRLGLQKHSLTQLGFEPKGLKMRTADRRDVQLDEFVCLDISVAGVRRRVQCVVNPAMMAQEPQNRPDSAEILLGIPWLFDVNAVLRIRDFSVELGDPSRGESLRTICGPKHAFCSSHTLLMYPMDILTNIESRESFSCTPQVFAAESTTEENDSKTPPSEGGDTKPLTLSQVWHDLNISQFSLRDLPSWGYFSDGPTPAIGNYGSVYWVDMPQFLNLLRADSAIPTADSRPALSDQSFQQLATWFPGSGGYPGDADAILGIFLAAFFAPDAAAHIMSGSKYIGFGFEVDFR